MSLFVNEILKWVHCQATILSRERGCMGVKKLQNKTCFSIWWWKTPDKSLVFINICKYKSEIGLKSWFAYFFSLITKIRNSKFPCKDSYYNMLKFFIHVFSLLYCLTLKMKMGDHMIWKKKIQKEVIVNPHKDKNRFWIVIRITE